MPPKKEAGGGEEPTSPRGHFPHIEALSPLNLRPEDKLEEQDPAKAVEAKAVVWVNRGGDGTPADPKPVNWCKGEVLAPADGEGTVVVRLAHEKAGHDLHPYPLKDLLGGNDEPPDQCPDLAELQYRHAAPICDMLALRYKQSRIYTHTGARGADSAACRSLLVVNPYCEVSTRERKEAQTRELRGLQQDVLTLAQPHIQATVTKVLHDFLFAGSRKAEQKSPPPPKNFTFVLSGESGSGKTETARDILNCLLVPDEGEEPHPVVGSLEAAAPVLEAFGNARTRKNNNASRFGRFTKLYLTVQERVDQDTGAISVLPEPIGGELEAFHLDLWRVTNCPEGERNYHVFYQLLKYCEQHPQERKNLHLDSDSWMDRIKRHEREMARLTGQDDYMELHYLSGTVRDAFPPVLDEDGQPFDKDLELWEDTQAALQDLGLGPKIEGIKKLLAAILLLGEVGFVPKEKDVEGSPLTARGLDEVAELLQVNAGELLKAVAQEGGNFLPVKGAVDKVKGLARHLYGALFRYVTSHIQDEIAPPPPADPTVVDERRFLGIVDLAGAEDRAPHQNTLEQLLNNLAHEQLQQYFVEQHFHREVELYKQEGLGEDIQKVVEFTDCAGILEGLCGAGGVLALLAAQKDAGEDGNDKFLASVKAAPLKQTFRDAKVVTVSTSRRLAGTFTVFHSTGDVHYAVEGFVERNRDALSPVLRGVIGDGSSLVAPLFKQDADPKLLTERFQESLEGLKKALDRTMPCFVKCIKPNDAKEPQILDVKKVSSQLASLGVLEVLDLAHKGFTYRPLYEAFIREQQILVCQHQPAGFLAREKAESFLGPESKVGVPELDRPGTDVQFGKTRIFTKITVQRMLTDMRARSHLAAEHVVGDIRNCISTVQAKTGYDQWFERCLRIQAYMKSRHARSDANRKKQLRRTFWTSVVATCRVRRFNLERLACFTLQTTIADMIAMARIQQYRKQTRLAVAKDKLTIFIATIKARTFVKERVLHLARARYLQCARNLAQNWKSKMSMRRFFVTRQLLYSCKRLALVHVAHVTYAQAFLRGVMTRRSPIGVQVREAIAEVRRVRANNEHSMKLQRHVMAFLEASRFDQLHGAARTTQHYIRAVQDHQFYQRQLAAACAIQRSFRAWLARSAISWAKILILHRSQQAGVRARARKERRALSRFVGIKPRSVVDLRILADVEAAYPRGWSAYYADVLARKDPVRQVCVGADHTVVLAENSVYAFGSDEVGQLGVNSTDQAPSLNVVCPSLRARVTRIACGRWHTLAVMEAKDPLQAWGLNHRGQCGVKIFVSGAAYTPQYPKTVRKPTPIQLFGQVLDISAGPCHSAAVCGQPGKSHCYVWGEAVPCGSPRDLRAPAKISTEYVTKVRLGDSYGFLVNDYGLSAFGSRCPQLGIGYLAKTYRVIKPAGMWEIELPVKDEVQWRTMEVTFMTAINTALARGSSELEVRCSGRNYLVELQLEPKNTWDVDWASHGYQTDLVTGMRHRIRMAEPGDARGIEVAQTAPLVRFDSDCGDERKDVVSIPINVRLPRVGVLEVACGESHIACVTTNGEVFEWGERRILRTKPCTVTRQADLLEYRDLFVDDAGLVYIPTPVRVQGLVKCTGIQACVDRTTVLQPGTMGAGGADGSYTTAGGSIHHSEACALSWNFVEVPEGMGESVLPALFSFRFLRTCHHLEQHGSASMAVALAVTDWWSPLEGPELDQVLLEDRLERGEAPHSPTQRARGQRQPTALELGTPPALALSPPARGALASPVKSFGGSPQKQSPQKRQLLRSPQFQKAGWGGSPTTFGTGGPRRSSPPPSERSPEKPKLKVHTSPDKQKYRGGLLGPSTVTVPTLQEWLSPPAPRQEEEEELPRRRPPKRPARTVDTGGHMDLSTYETALSPTKARVEDAAVQSEPPKTQDLIGRPQFLSPTHIGRGKKGLPPRMADSDAPRTPARVRIVESPQRMLSAGNRGLSPPRGLDRSPSPSFSPPRRDREEKARALTDIQAKLRHMSAAELENLASQLR